MISKVSCVFLKLFFEEGVGMFITKEKKEVPSIFEDGVPSLVRLSRSYDNPHWYNIAHVHSSDTELVFISSGKASFTINQKTFLVEKGDILIVEKGFIHSTISDAKEPSDIFSCSVANYKIRGMERNYLLRSPNILPVMKSGSHEEFFRHCWREMQAYQEMEDPISRSICDMIAGSIAGLYYSLFFNQTETYEIPAPHFTQDILIYIYEHYCENITLERLSKVFHMSAGHISHEFSKAFGISPINYAINLKLDQAKWLLIQSEKSLTEIAAEIGYQNLQHFTNIFQKRNGCTPLEFKEKYSHKKKLLY